MRNFAGKRGGSRDFWNQAVHFEQNLRYNHTMTNEERKQNEQERMREHQEMMQRMREQQYWERMDNMTDSQWRRMERGE